MAVFDVNLYEPIHPGWSADSTAVTADSAIYTADGGPLEGATDALDAIVIAAGAAIIAEAASAADVLDAEVIPAFVEVGGGLVRPLKPFPVEGVGFGILPQLEGEAHGIVIAIGAGVGTLPGVRGEATGSVGVAGRIAGQLLVRGLRGLASGERGQAGAAVALLSNPSVVSKGAVGACGAGIGILELKGAAVGQHDDDDDAAIVAWLLAA